MTLPKIEQSSNDYESLDALAEALPVGMIRYRIGERTDDPLGRIIGYAWGLPREIGGPDVPSCVILNASGNPGLVYPDEITIHVGLPRP